ncbi:MAG: MMPL family transporter [Chromatiales bacterium]|nr:MMPL family transporter [Chromatiales bacterium]
MESLLLRFARHPWWTLFALFALCVLAATRLGDVRVYIGADELLVRGDPQRSYYEEISRRFGEERVALLYLADDAALDPERLKVLQRAISAIEALPFVERVDSLFSIPEVRTVDGFITKEPYLKELPKTQAAADEIHTKALNNAFLRDVLLSVDRRVIAAAIVLRDDGSADEDIALTLDERIAPLREIYAQAFVIGYPEVRLEIAERIRAEQGRLLPWAVGALLLTLFISLRQVVDVLVPLMTSAVSILWTLGLMGAAGIPLNIVTSMVPILLIIIGSTEDVHLLAEFRFAQRRGRNVDAAIGDMSRRMGRTVLLTFVTTFMGFLSVAFGGVELLQQFGLVAAAGLLFNFIATIMLIPAILKLIGRWRLDGRSPFLARHEFGIARTYCRHLRMGRHVVVALMIGLTVAAAIGVPRISINGNPVETLPPDSQSREQFRLVSENLAGMETVSIVVDARIQDTFLKARYVDELKKLQTFVEGTGRSRSTTSFADYLALLNAAFQEFETPRIPQTDAEVNELMLFLDYSHVRGYVSEDYSSARVLIRHRLTDERELRAFLRDIAAYLGTELDRGLDWHITGPSVLSLSSTHAMIRGQLQSVGVLLAAIVFMMALMFADIRVGLIAALPNLFPVIVLFGAMGWFDIPLNIGTTMAAAITIGIAVDGTMHLMLRYNERLKTQGDFARAIHTTIQSEALPMIATSAALVAGFLVFTQSEFLPVRQFGILSALAISVALVANFVVLPLAIASLRVVTLWDLLSVPEIKEVIRSSVAFKGLSDWQIRRFIASGAIRRQRAGDMVYAVGDSSDAMYLVLEGAFESRLPVGEGEQVVARFGPGDLLGEIALLANEPRHARAVAVADSRLLALTRDSIENNRRWHPYFTSQLFVNLAETASRRLLRLIDREYTGPAKAQENPDEN